jgi:hypothetical protein
MEESARAADASTMAMQTTELDTKPDLAALELWTAWVNKLMSYAALYAPDARTLRTLTGAAEDAASLRDALSAATTGWLDPEQTRVLRAIYGLWDANLTRVEQLASSVDVEWYEVWRVRSASSRLRAAGSLADECALEAIA